MIGRIPIWTVIFHFFIIVFVLDYLVSTADSELFFLTMGATLAGSLGAFVRNKNLRLVCFSSLVIPALLGCFTFFQTIGYLIAPLEIMHTCRGIMEDSAYLYGNLGVGLFFPVLIYGNTTTWAKSFSVREQLFYYSILLGIIILAQFNPSFLDAINDWIDQVNTPKSKFESCW